MAVLKLVTKNKKVYNHSLKKWKIAFFISVVLNVVLIGLLIKG